MIKNNESIHKYNTIFHISGQVQGVGFRFSTYLTAKKLNLSGYVKNLINGDVEILASGTDSDIEALRCWLKAGGPKSAKIAGFIEKRLETNEQFSSFIVRY